MHAYERICADMLLSCRIFDYYVYGKFYNSIDVENPFGNVQSKGFGTIALKIEAGKSSENDDNFIDAGLRSEWIHFSHQAQYKLG